MKNEKFNDFFLFYHMGGLYTFCFVFIKEFWVFYGMPVRGGVFLPMNIEEYRAVWHKYFHIPDDTRLDVPLAIYLSREMKGTPLWLIIVSNSGDMKTEQLLSLEDDGILYDEKTGLEQCKIRNKDEDLETKTMHKFTSKTLVSGYIHAEDLAPKLKNKVLLFLDFAELLNLHPAEKILVWSQLRGLYDGRAGSQTGSGTDVTYRDIRVSMLAASTPTFDNQLLIHQSLGTRELLYRPSHIGLSKINMMNMAWDNEEYENQMRKEIHHATRIFLQEHKLKKIEIPEEIKKKLMNFAQLLTYMRATGTSDSYSGELISDVHLEMPTRVLKQLKRLYICLKSLDENYSDERAEKIIKDIVFSSCDKIKFDVFNFLVVNPNSSTNSVATALRLGKKTVKVALNNLFNIKLIEKEEEKTTTPYGQEIIIRDDWRVCDDAPILHFLGKNETKQQKIIV